jgi:hypothetical protein
MSLPVPAITVAPWITPLELYLRMKTSTMPADKGRTYPDAVCVPDAERLRLLMGTVPVDK